MPIVVSKHVLLSRTTLVFGGPVSLAKEPPMLRRRRARALALAIAAACAIGVAAVVNLGQ